ncbi:MAG: rhomboid family intramembrane serine protease [Nocardioidaceae bacterium]
MSTPETPATGAPEQEAPVCYRHTDREAHIRCQRCERRICPDCMRPASVGFQCPSCIAEGAKSTRSGRTAYGGQRSGNPALVSQVLIGINVVVWLAIVATGGASSRLFDALALLPSSAYTLVDGTPTLVRGVADGAPWQLLTSMFTHIEIWHIGFNMLALWTLGPQLEVAIGRIRFLALYFLSGLAGSATVLWFSAPNSQTLGASGAIFGLMGALLVVAIKVRGDVRGMLTWIGINFVITFVLVRLISWQGHLGGFVGGLLLGAAIVYAPRTNRTRWQVGGIVLVALAVLVATVARIAVLAA